MQKLSKHIPNPVTHKAAEDEASTPILNHLFSYSLLDHSTFWAPVKPKELKTEAPAMSSTQNPEHREFKTHTDLLRPKKKPKPTHPKIRRILRHTPAHEILYTDRLSQEWTEWVNLLM